MKKKIIVANNHWANIGDAFYQNSLIYDLQEVYGDQADVISGEEGPCHIDRLLKISQKNVFNYSSFGSANWYVISGPVLHKGFPSLYASLLMRLKESNTKIVLMSVGGLEYDQEEIELCRQVLERYPPYILTSRDSQTYKAYGDLAKYSYDGICSAFYSSWQYPGYETPQLGNYIVYSFDAYSEPEIKLRASESGDIDWLKDLVINNTSLRQLGRIDRFMDNFKSHTETIEGLNIIRLHHTPLTKITPLIYNRPNTFVSLNPYSYLNIIKNAKLVLASRLHACVLAISYQVPTMLFLKNKRSYLLDRLGLQCITEKPMKLESEKIQQEHHKFKAFLASIDID